MPGTFIPDPPTPQGGKFIPDATPAVGTFVPPSVAQSPGAFVPDAPVGVQDVNKNRLPATPQYQWNKSDVALPGGVPSSSTKEMTPEEWETPLVRIMPKEPLGNLKGMSPLAAGLAKLVEQGGNFIQGLETPRMMSQVIMGAGLGSAQPLLWTGLGASAFNDQTKRLADITYNPYAEQGKDFNAPGEQTGLALDTAAPAVFSVLPAAHMAPKAVQPTLPEIQGKVPLTDYLNTDRRILDTPEKAKSRLIDALQQVVGQASEESIDAAKTGQLRQQGEDQFGNVQKFDANGQSVQDQPAQLRYNRLPFVAPNSNVIPPAMAQEALDRNQQRIFVPGQEPTALGQALTPNKIIAPSELQPKPITDVAGGKVSFASEAGGVPFARQSAERANPLTVGNDLQNEQAALMQGNFIPDKGPGDSAADVREQPPTAVPVSKELGDTFKVGQQAPAQTRDLPPQVPEDYVKSKANAGRKDMLLTGRNQPVRLANGSFTVANENEPALFKSDQGYTAMITKELAVGSTDYKPQVAKPWRVTYFNDLKNPIEHETFDTWQEAHNEIGNAPSLKEHTWQEIPVEQTSLAAAQAGTSEPSAWAEKSTPARQVYQMQRLGMEPGKPFSVAQGLDNIQRSTGQGEPVSMEDKALAGFLKDQAPDLNKLPVRPESAEGRNAASYNHDTGISMALDQSGTRYPEKEFLHEAAHAVFDKRVEQPMNVVQKAAVHNLIECRKQATDALPREVQAFLKDKYTPMMDERNRNPKGFNYDAFQKMFADAGINQYQWDPILYGLHDQVEYHAQLFGRGKAFFDWNNGIKARGFLGSVGEWAKTLVHKILGFQEGSLAERAFDNLQTLKESNGWVDATSEKPVGLGKTSDVMPMGRVEREVTAAKDYWERRKQMVEVPVMFDRVKNESNIQAKQRGNDIRQRTDEALGKTKDNRENDARQEALTFVIQADGDRTRLDNFKATLKAGKDSKWKPIAIKAVEKAQALWDKLLPVADQYNKLNAIQVWRENANGTDTEYRSGYVNQATDMSDVNAVLFDRGHGSSGGFTKERVFDNYADKIAAGSMPVSLNAADLLEHRFRVGDNRVNMNRMVVEPLKATLDPVSKTPIIQNLEIRVKKGGLGARETVTPQGYESRFFGNQPVAVHKGYVSLLDALTGESAFQNNAAGRALQEAFSTAKHTVLLFDVYHPIRLWMYSAPLRASLRGPFDFMKSTKAGQYVLDYNEPTLKRMAAAGEIDPAMLPELARKRQVQDIALRTGYNVGRISDNLYTDLVSKLNIPRAWTGGRDFAKVGPVNVPLGFGHYNKALFDHFQRGLMMDTYQIEFDRVKEQKPTLSDDAVGREVSLNLNKRFGNMMNQSWVKGKTYQDLLRLAFLAPGWNEGLIRSEMGAVTQIPGAIKGAVQHPIDTAMGRRAIGGALVRDAGMMFAAYFTANQVINYITRGNPTWENKDDQPGAKLSAWIPGTKGSKGFFLNPFSLVAEISHHIINRAEKDDSVIDAIKDLARGKASVPGRAAITFWMKKDWQGNHLTDWEALKEAGKEIVPVPMQAKPVFNALRGKETYPGEAEKSLLQSVGLRPEAKKDSHREQVENSLGRAGQSLSLSDRAKGERLVKGQAQSIAQPLGKQAGAEKHIEQALRVQDTLLKAMPSSTQDFLTTNKLSLPGFEPQIHMGQTAVKLTDDETKAYTAIVTQKYQEQLDKIIPKIVDNMPQAVKQRLVKEAAGRAKNLAEAQYRKVLTSTEASRE